MLPAQPLRFLIRAYQYMRSQIGSDGFVVPAMERCMMLLPEHTEYRMDGPIASRVTLTHATLMGPHDVPVMNYTEREASGYTVEFTPTGAARLLGIAPRDVYNQGIPAGEIVAPSVVRELTERLHEARTPQHGFAVLDSVFLHLLQTEEVAYPDKLVAGVIGSLHAAPSMYADDAQSIAGISDSLAVSARHVRRIFRDVVGLSPKRFQCISRISRAMRILVRKPDVSLTDLALTLGYYDCAHFAHDFKRMTLVAPRQFVDSLPHREIRVLAEGPRDAP